MAPKAWPVLPRKTAPFPPLHMSVLRVVPTFFVLGACMELFMQKVPVGGRTFYDVALQKEVGVPKLSGIDRSVRYVANAGAQTAYPGPMRAGRTPLHRPPAVGSCREEGRGAASVKGVSEATIDPCMWLW
jgi:hypothetical protein